MRLLRLHLQAFGPFTGRILDLARGGARLALIYGPNEAGKSATLRAIGDLRFGVPQLSADNFRHAHPDMRIAGVFADPSGGEIGLVRRKGRGQTLLRRPIGRLDQEGDEDQPASPELEAALTGGLSRDEYDTMFSLDHQRLRQGGEALLEGEGETGAALFEASSGVRSVRAILERLDASARQFYCPARARKAGASTRPCAPTTTPSKPIARRWCVRRSGPSWPAATRPRCWRSKRSKARRASTSSSGC
jgi:exonuclease SbcC